MLRLSVQFLLLCVLIGCNNSSSEADRSISATDSNVVEAIKAAKERTDQLIEKYKNTTSPGINDEIQLKIGVNELDVIIDAFSKLSPQVWNRVRLKEPEFFTEKSYDLSNWDDLKRKLDNQSYRIDAINRYLTAKNLH